MSPHRQPEPETEHREEHDRGWKRTDGTPSASSATASTMSWKLRWVGDNHETTYQFDDAQRPSFSPATTCGALDQLPCPTERSTPRGLSGRRFCWWRSPAVYRLTRIALQLPIDSPVSISTSAGRTARLVASFRPMRNGAGRLAGAAPTGRRRSRRAKGTWRRSSPVRRAGPRRSGVGPEPRQPWRPTVELDLFAYAELSSSSGRRRLRSATTTK